MQINIYHINAFTTQLFKGNPAAVCVLTEWLPDHVLHQIAKENNLPVTAFLVYKEDAYHIRWITPEYELDLCGHGSLSAAYVIFNFIHPELQQLNLHSRIETLPVTRNGDLVTLNFPAKSIEACSLPLLVEGLGAIPKEIYQHHNERCFAVFNSEDDVRNLQPNMQILKKLPHRGISATARSVTADFVSRTFYPQKTMSEDAVTGASHCLLAPYWAMQLNKSELHAKQVSQREGEVFCRVKDDRVFISGRAVVYMQGRIQL